MSAGPNGLKEVKKSPHRKRGGQPGNTNAYKLKRHQAASAKCQAP